MQYTSNYNLMLPEGTDIVNPLVQQNPNFSAIDAAMFANKQGSVGSATELTAGTVHTITRANPDSNVIKFTATSNWTAGDSMVIDSTPVSVYLSDGTAPETGAYIINTEVLAILSGSRVTLIVSKGDQNAAETAYNNSVSGLNATNVQDAIDELSTHQLIGTITADGIKTLSQLYDDLYAASDRTKIKAGSYITDGTELYYIQRVGTEYRFGMISLTSFRSIRLRSSGSAFFSVVVANDGTVTVNDVSTNIMTAGTTIQLWS